MRKPDSIDPTDSLVQEQHKSLEQGSWMGIMEGRMREPFFLRMDAAKCPHVRAAETAAFEDLHSCVDYLSVAMLQLTTLREACTRISQIAIKDMRISIFQLRGGSPPMLCIGEGGSARSPLDRSMGDTMFVGMPGSDTCRCIRAGSSP